MSIPPSPHTIRQPFRYARCINDIVKRLALVQASAQAQDELHTVQLPIASNEENFAMLTGTCKIFSCYSDCYHEDYNVAFRQILVRL